MTTRLEPHAQAIRDEVAASKAQLETLESEMTEHTPGNWYVDQTYQWPSKVRSDAHPDRWICDAAGPSGEPLEALANARLISAAPDMLKACQLEEAAEAARDECPECQHRLEMAPETCPRCFPFFDKARVARRAALAKAQPDDMESDG